MSLRIGVDLGGTKIEAAALAADGSLRARLRVATPQGDYGATVAAVAQLVRAIEHELGVQAPVGVGHPGAEDRRGLIKNANSTCLNGRPLRADLQAALGRELRLANDANCFALSEASDGAGRGAAVVFGVILGTGVGGGIAVHGQVLEGAHRIAGEWGHNPLPCSEEDPRADAPPCYCGRYGCIETYLSGPALAAQHRRDHGVTLDAAQIAAATADPACSASLARYQRRLARALATVVNLLDPDVIVLGGGLSAIGSLYQTLPALCLEHVFCAESPPCILPPVHGDASGVRGAAWLWPLTSA